MKETLERELKLGAGRGFRLPDLPGEALEPRVFTSTYFDSPDYRLAQQGVTLRRRVERSKGAWQLKLPRGQARLELEAPGGRSSPPERMRELLTAYLRGGELAPVAKLRTRRVGIRVANGDSPLADVTLDLVSVIADGKIARSFREIEAELVDGNEKALKRLERLLRDAGAHDSDARPKLFQALELEPPQVPTAPSPEAPSSEHLRWMLGRQYRAILAHDPGTRLGTEAEELHQMRVATRRLRAFLRAARPMLDEEWAESLRAELSWLGGALGPVRDLDVLIEHLLDDAAALELREQRALRKLFAALDAERAQERRAMLDALESERYLALLERLEHAVESPRLVATDETVEDIAAREFKKLRKAARRAGTDATDEELHALRIRGKRARYAAELAETVVGKRATEFIREAKAFQDVLGDHQDAVVAETKIRELVRGRGGTVLAFSAGRLVEREERRRERARASWPEAWKRLRKRGKKAWS